MSESKKQNFLNLIFTNGIQKVARVMENNIRFPVEKNVQNAALIPLLVFAKENYNPILG